MSERDEDVCSDSSWLLAGCDSRSDSSWLFAGGHEIQGRLQHLEDDVRSNTSWELMAEAEHSILMPNRCCVMPQEMRIKSNPESFADLDTTVSLIDLIHAGRADAALHLLRSSPQPSQLAAQVDTCSDSSLSWTAYKAKRSDITWLELTVELLRLAPADVRKQNSMRFLPLHDAAWGNAPAAIAVMLCAVFPHGVHVRTCGQTPHEVGHYHHTTRQGMFSWPERDRMLQLAAALSCESEWLETIASLRLSSLDQEQLRSMSVVDLQVSLSVQQPIAELIACFLAPPRARAPAWACALPSIPESRSSSRLRRQASFYQAADFHTTSCVYALPELTCDDHHVREPCSKSSGYYAGLRRARNSRCSFRDLMVIADDMGGRHHMSLHAAHAIPKMAKVAVKGRERLSKIKEPKWPSKAGPQRERKRDRAVKECLGRV